MTAISHSTKTAQAALLSRLRLRVFLCTCMSSRSRIRVPPKKTRSWGITLIQSGGKFLGYVEASDQKAAEIEAAKAFTLTEWQRKRLLVRERM
jgi:hypothetical protein